MRGYNTEPQRAGQCFQNYFSAHLLSLHRNSVFGEPYIDIFIKRPHFFRPYTQEVPCPLAPLAARGSSRCFGRADQGGVVSTKEDAAQLYRRVNLATSRKKQVRDDAAYRERFQRALAFFSRFGCEVDAAV